MDLPKYIKRLFKPSVKRRAKAMRNAKKARTKTTQDGQLTLFKNLEKKLGYKFSDKEILKEALTHPGAIGFSKGKIKSNQRLEFLGDAILQSIITDAVYKKFEELNEGDLTKIRIALTQGEFLSELSEHLDIPNYLILPKGCENLRHSTNAAEDAFEAVIGAIYMDSNFTKAKEIVMSWYRQKLEDLPTLISQQNPKGTLQELAAKRGEKIEYVLLGQSGPDHQKVFEVEVVIGGHTLAKASASSKKSAEIKAARDSIKAYMESCQNECEQPQTETSPKKITKKPQKSNAKEYA